MTVMIGVDPHKPTHTAVAIDQDKDQLSQVQVRATRRQVAQLLSGAEPFEKRTWAVESAGGLGYLLTQQLVAAGEEVLDVPATLASRVRVLSSGSSNKNGEDGFDAVLPTDPIEQHLTRARPEPPGEHLPVVREDLLGQPIAAHREGQRVAHRLGGRPGHHHRRHAEPRVIVDPRYILPPTRGRCGPRPRRPSAIAPSPGTAPTACSPRACGAAPAGSRARDGPDTARSTCGPAAD